MAIIHVYFVLKDGAAYMEVELTELISRGSRDNRKVPKIVSL